MLSDDVDVDLEGEIRGLVVELNGLLLSECAGFETDLDVQFLGEEGRPYFTLVTARFPMTPEDDDALDVKMSADEAERVAYQLLAAVEEGRAEAEDGA